MVELLSLHQFQQHFLILVLPWSIAEKNLIADDSKGEKISLWGVVSALQSLWSHVGWRAHVNIPNEILFPNNGKSKITDLPCVPRLQYIRRLEIPMQHLFLQQISIARDDLLHDSYGCAFRKLLVLLDEVLESPLGTVLEHKIIKVAFFDDAMAFDDVGVIQLLVDLHLLLQECQILLLPPYLALVDDLDGKQLARISC